MATSETPQRGYTFGYSKATTSSHASRTIHTDGAFAIPHIKPHHNVLDVGSGPGSITLGLASLIDPSLGGHVTGVDVGAPVLAAATALAAAAQNIPQGALTFQQANVLEALPFADGTFDVVFTSQTLIHLAPAPAAPVKALKEIRRVLKEGGLLCARDAAVITYHPFREEIQRAYTDRMFRVVGTDGPCGVHMRAYLRAAGWAVDDGGKVRIGAGTNVVSGREGTAFMAATMGGRLAVGDPFREGWVRAGITEGECDEARDLIERWGEAEDAWYGALQSEVLAWK